MNEPVHITDAEFEKVVLKSSMPVIVDSGHPGADPAGW
jgi:thioredoxin-like negative regulator of GroEL